MATLYDLTNEQLYLYELLQNDGIDQETGEVNPVVAEQLAMTEKELDKKILGVGLVYKQLLADSKMLKEEEDTLIARRKRAERNAEYLKSRLEASMIALDKKEFKDTKLNITFRKSSKVEIIDENIIPKEFMAEKITYTPMKKEIGDTIKSGAEVSGATLVETQNIQIK